ncbi:hypothetical protein [Streptomyces sp. V1I6]|nr:hypothetical protein [Streptomyces sp. V1I6]
MKADLIVLAGGTRERRAVHDKLPPQIVARTSRSPWRRRPPL